MNLKSEAATGGVLWEKIVGPATFVKTRAQRFQKVERHPRWCQLVPKYALTY